MKSLAMDFCSLCRLDDGPGLCELKCTNFCEKPSCIKQTSNQLEQGVVHQHFVPFRNVSQKDLIENEAGLVDLEDVNPPVGELFPFNR